MLRDYQFSRRIGDRLYIYHGCYPAHTTENGGKSRVGRIAPGANTHKTHWNGNA